MKTPESILEELNKLPDAEDYSVRRLRELIDSMQELTGAKVKFLDFTFFNEKRLKKLKKKKMNYVKVQDFETAADIRQLEKECLNYIELRTECDITRSMFFYDGRNLCYFYLGNALNDRKVKRFFNTLEKNTQNK